LGEAQSNSRITRSAAFSAAGPVAAGWRNLSLCRPHLKNVAAVYVVDHQ
jgi:hypothetical protein